MRAWSARQVQERSELIALGYFGSYARGDWGVGSDLDVIAIVDGATAPFESRAVEWDLTVLPVPADLIVYTQAEWTALQSEENFFVRKMKQEAVWTYLREENNKPI